MKYFFDTDSDSHWYMIPSEWRSEWEELSQKEDGWEDERWQKFEDCRTGGGISNIEFDNPNSNS